jgi:hypothetical protein
MARRSMFRSGLGAVALFLAENCFAQTPGVFVVTAYGAKGMGSLTIPGRYRLLPTQQWHYPDAAPFSFRAAPTSSIKAP